ncbi:polysaccharide deacetylase [Chitinispirillum alkaliphilum]|nr:polysaccharide deacetylase [Chitinispirillum alkaliphilum]
MHLSSALSAVLAPLICGITASLLFGREQEKVKAGLLFHSVVPSPSLSMSQMSADKFQQFLHLLKANGKTTNTLSQHCKNQDNNSIVLSFDDGLEDFYTYAYPLLEKMGFKATLFPIAEYVGKEVNWDVFGTKKHCSEKMLREISDSGHEIGSHSLTHANLPWLNDKALCHELRISKNILENITGKEVKSISFPFGSWNERVWEAAKQNGYKFGTIYRRHKYARADLLPVFGVYRFDSPDEIYQKAFPENRFPIPRISAKIMSHFSKGSPLWKFRENYTELKCERSGFRKTV